MIELLWNAPVSEVKMQRMLDAMQPLRGMPVVDFGCGCGEVLIRLCQQYGVQATGVDSSSQHIAEARRRATVSGASDQLQFVVAAAATHPAPPGSLGAVLCMGATHVFGLGPDAVRNSIEAMSAMLAPGGQMLVADGYMKQPTPEGYKAFIGDSIPDDLTHAAIVAMGEQSGLTPLGAWTSTTDEWDEFEWGYQRIVERKAAAGDAWAVERLDSRRQWMTAYLKWGRNTLGYGTYLFQKPAEG